ncbi:hypothetical protein Tco_0647922 [Tanacetum coccineum]
MDVAFGFVGKDNDGLGYGLDRSTNVTGVHESCNLSEIFGHKFSSSRSTLSGGKAVCPAEEIRGRRGKGNEQGGQKGAPGRQSTSEWFWVIFLMKLNKKHGHIEVGRHGPMPGGMPHWVAISLRQR